MDVAEFYTAVKRLSEERQIADGANHRPHFSMRTLARALTFAADMASALRRQNSAGPAMCVPAQRLLMRKDELKNGLARRARGRTLAGTLRFLIWFRIPD